ncbi:MAG: hypothetical protein P4L85_27105 [Paludisphaera borealis]|uniref:hypothetical protein n=1 Tax=Paludisphaera borealis TaxID=1387353 RepID=UPI00284FD2E1|nr:hypothetical protein [Paludisphaera borealis]MDR3623051.1 hypothetical protein [Paludisphaera borealis]
MEDQERILLELCRDLLDDFVHESGVRARFIGYGTIVKLFVDSGQRVGDRRPEFRLKFWPGVSGVRIVCTSKGFNTGANAE